MTVKGVAERIFRGLRHTHGFKKNIKYVPGGHDYDTEFNPLAALGYAPHGGRSDQSRTTLTIDAIVLLIKQDRIRPAINREKFGLNTPIWGFEPVEDEVKK